MGRDFDADHAVIARCIDYVRATSAEQLKRFARLKEVRIEAEETGGLPFRQQLAHVLISGDDVELNLKVHFMFEEATRLTAHKLHLQTIEREQAIDFVKELCNLVAGRSKAMFEAAGLTLGQSLPFSMQGYNEVFYPLALHGGLLEAWTLATAEGDLSFSAFLVARSPAAIDRLGQVSYAAELPQGTIAIEFF